MILDIDNIPAPLLRMILDIDNIPSPLLSCARWSMLLARGHIRIVFFPKGDNDICILNISFKLFAIPTGGGRGFVFPVFVVACNCVSPKVCQSWNE